MTAQNRMTLLSMDPLRTSSAEVTRARRDYETLTAELAAGKPDALGEARVAVVGGGIVGLMSAYFAAAAGADVQVYEAKALGGAASGRNAGGIYAGGRDMGEVALARVSMDLWEALGERGMDVKFRRRGHTIVALNATELSLLRKAAELYISAGMHVELKEGAEAVAELPFVTPKLAGGLFSPDDGQGYPFTAVAALRDEIRRLGGEVYAHLPVRALLAERGQVNGVRTALGDHRADAVLLAAGPWTAGFGEEVGARLPVAPRRSQLTVSERLPVHDDFPFVSGNRVYARQTHAGNVLIGGGGPWEENGYATTTTRKALSVYGTYMTEMFPGLARVPIIRAFAGTVELTPDHYPLLGRVPGSAGLWVSAGYNGHGFGLSAAAGRLFAELLGYDLAGQEVPATLSDALRGYDPARFEERRNA